MTISVTPRWVDWEKLDTPISDEKPEGESLRYEGTYDKIQDARKQDNPRLDQGVWETDLKQADWDQVIQQSVEALETQTKDLQIGAWLLEAWAHRHRFEGIRNGLEVLFRLCEHFWDTAYPQIDEGDFEARIRPFEWVNSKLAVQLKLIPLSAPRLTEHVPVTFADYEIASRNENEARKNQKARDNLESELNYTRFFASCDHTPPEFYRELATQVQGSRDRLRNLEGFLDDKCGKESPSLLDYREGLRAINRLLEEILQRQGIDAEEIDPQPVGQPTESMKEGTEFVDNETLDVDQENTGSIDQEEVTATGNGVPGPPGKIRSRSEAYRLLTEVANYLERTEPHSPTPHLIRRAVSWGDMTLDQLLLEIVRDDNDLRFIYDLLGLGPGPQETDD